MEKREKVRRSAIMERIAGEVIDSHYEELGWIKENGVRIVYAVSDREKKAKKGSRLVHGSTTRANPTEEGLIGCDFVITFHTPNIRYHTDEQLRILMYHELLHIGVNKSGYTVKPHDYIIEDFRAVVDEYGIDWAMPKSYEDREYMWWDEGEQYEEDEE
jgi:predicted metallopeptidase